MVLGLLVRARPGTCPILGSISLADGGLLMLDECLEHYQVICDQRDDTSTRFLPSMALTSTIHTIPGGKLEGWYKPRGLPKATSLASSMWRPARVNRVKK